MCYSDHITTLEYFVLKDLPSPAPHLLYNSTFISNHFPPGPSESLVIPSTYQVPLFVWNLQYKIHSFLSGFLSPWQIIHFSVWPQAYTFFCVPLQSMHTPFVEIISLYCNSSYMISHYAVKSSSQGHGSAHFFFLSPVTQWRRYTNVYWVNTCRYKEIISFLPDWLKLPFLA